MRDLNSFPGKKIRVDSIEQALEKVRETYPDATKEGSIGAYSFSKDGETIAEMWLARKEGWWLRIKKPEERQQVQQIYTKIFDDMLKGDIEAIDNHLNSIDLENTSPACIISILIATITIKEKLPSRGAFLDKAKKFVGQKYGNDEVKELDRYK